MKYLNEYNESNKINESNDIDTSMKFALVFTGGSIGTRLKIQYLLKDLCVI